MERTKRESNRRRRDEKWQTCWCCRDQQRACRMPQPSAEKPEHTKPAEKKRVASVPKRESSWQIRQSRPCHKGKELRRLSRAPHRIKSIQCQRIKESSSREKGKRRIFLCIWTVRVKVKSKVIPTRLAY